MSLGMITNLGGESFMFEFDYYPESISYPRSVDYSIVKTPGMPLCDVNYSGGNNSEFSFTATIDGLESGSETYAEDQIYFLEGLTFPVKSTGGSLKDQQFKKNPQLKLILDGRITPCVLKSIDVTPLMNFSNGKIARADVKLTFLEIYYQGLSDDLYNKRLSKKQNGTKIRVNVSSSSESKHNYTSNIIAGGGVKF